MPKKGEHSNTHQVIGYLNNARAILYDAFERSRSAQQRYRLIGIRNLLNRCLSLLTDIDERGEEKEPSKRRKYELAPRRKPRTTRRGK